MANGNRGVGAQDPRLIRQERLNLALPKSVAIVGCGGVGTWLALFLANAGVTRFILFDEDHIEESNLNRLPYSRAHIGQQKSRDLASQIVVIYPSYSVIALGHFAPGILDGIEIPEVFICSTDTLASRKMVYEYAKANGARYIEASAEGEMGGCSATPPEWATPAELDPGYASVPVWAGSSILAAVMAVYHIVHPNTMQSVRAGWEDGKFTFFSEGGLAPPKVAAAPSDIHAEVGREGEPL